MAYNLIVVKTEDGPEATTVVNYAKEEVYRGLSVLLNKDQSHFKILASSMNGAMVSVLGEKEEIHVTYAKLRI